MRVLLIEDDQSTANYLAKGLQELGHVTEVAHTGRDGLFLALNGSFDAIITDRMLPGPDGVSIVRALRASGDRTPVLIVTALGEVKARIAGLDAGADDYIAKPFAFSELRARLDAITRRTIGTTADAGETGMLRVVDLEMNLLRRTVRRAGRPIELLPTEFRLLEFMMRHPGQVLTRTMLLERVWDFHFEPTTNVVDVHISRLRHKLDTGGPPLIRTLRGAGYMLGPDG